MKQWMVVLMLSLAASVAWAQDVNDVNAVEETVEISDANETSLIWVIWPMAGEDVAELRLGVEWGIIEGYIAPGYTAAIEDETPEITNLNVIGICNAINADMATKLFPDLTMPDGALYAGLYGGWSFTEGESQAGWLIGGRLEFASDKNVWIDFCTEYQSSLHKFTDDQEDWSLLFGPRISF